jgi:S1-C subfamily serine protease
MTDTSPVAGFIGAAWPLDIVLVLILLAYLVGGYLSGFVRSMATIVGVIAGAVAAFFAVPLVTTWVPDQLWRITVTIAVVILLIVLGHSIGVWAGRAIRARFKRSPLRLVDRILGAAANTVAAALILALVALSITGLGIPVMSQAISSSVVLRAISDTTPDPLEAYLAQLRSTVVGEGIPSITQALGGVTTSPDLPSVDTGTDALTVAARSVVRITGTAYECGQNQSGSGFVVADGRIVTNAHVVAGVDEPIVQVQGGAAYPGRIVYFDDVMDLAVIAVSGLSTPALPLVGESDDGEPFGAGSTGVLDGFPYGGPFSTNPAEVLSVSTTAIEDIYGNSSAPREIYTLAADVREGNSGGPLLSEQGEVAGVVFARSAELDNVGYALTLSELGPVVTAAPTLTAAVPAGACMRG